MLSSDCGMGREGMSRRHAFYKMVALVQGTNIVPEGAGAAGGREPGRRPEVLAHSHDVDGNPTALIFSSDVTSRSTPVLSDRASSRDHAPHNSSPRTVARPVTLQGSDIPERHQQRDEDGHERLAGDEARRRSAIA